jgi:DNA-binding transcriptional regulator YiaG
VGRKTLKAAKPKPYPSVPVTLGDHLKKRRCELGLLQREVAAQLRVNEWTWRNWETNRRAPAIRFVPRIIAFLGYDPYLAPSSLPERILAARRRQETSRREFARRLGLDEETLALWERGTRQPRGEYLISVGQFLRGTPA